MAKNKSNLIGNTKRSTDVLINEAIARQNKWLEKRRAFTKRFLKTMNFFNQRAVEILKPIKEQVVVRKAANAKSDTAKKKSKITPFWFPIVCGIVVLLVSLTVVCNYFGGEKSPNNTKTPVAENKNMQIGVLKPKENSKITFDIVRINRNGNLIVAGSWKPNQKVSVLLNDKVVATELTNDTGDFVYSPMTPLKSGNYIIELISATSKDKSADKVFLYVSEKGYKKSVSLLMHENGSTLLQSPKLNKSDLQISKIDYLETGRLVVTGSSLPRLRVSIALDNKFLGWTRISDSKNFGIGADIGKLIPGKEYKLAVRLHDGDGRTVTEFKHKFIMPKSTGEKNTFYTVRHDDCLWVIANNFMGSGFRFSIIADVNHIENPNLIFPNQKLKIPVGK